LLGQLWKKESFLPRDEMTQLLTDIRKALESRVDEAYKMGAERYFKEPINILGVRLPEIRQISREFYSQVKNLGKTEFFGICEELLDTGIGEETTIAFDWAWRRKSQYELEDFSRFESWLERYVSNWGHCDDISCHSVGFMLHKWPKLAENMPKWGKSSNRWLRRSSAVSLIYPVRREVLVDKAFEIADILIEDEDDLVRKGYGWLLKEVSNAHPERVYDYVTSNVERMPRVAFRYAIEKLPDEMREKAMGK